MWSLVLLSFCASSTFSAFVDLEYNHFEIKNIEVHDYRIEVCGADCASYCTPTNCPLNVGGIITKDKNINGEYTAIIASTIGKPSIMIAHGNQKDMKISAAEMSSIPNFWVNSIQNLINFQQGVQYNIPYTKSLNLLAFSPDAAIVGLQLESIFEFTDNNNNDIFDASIDTVVRMYDLDRSWNQLYVNQSMVDGGANIAVMSFATSDGIFSFRVEVADRIDAPAPDPLIHVDTAVRTPNGARVVMSVKNFQYLNSSSKFAMKTVVIAPATQNTQHGYNQFKDYINIGTDKVYSQLGYFSWNADGLSSQTKSSLTETKFLASSSVKANYDSDISFGVGKSTLLNAQNTASDFLIGEAQVIYFSVQSPSPNSIYWDFDLGLGSAPLRARLPTYGNFVLILTMIIFVAVSILISHRFRPYDSTKKVEADYKEFNKDDGKIL